MMEGHASPFNKTIVESFFFQDSSLDIRTMTRFYRDSSECVLGRPMFGRSDSVSFRSDPPQDAIVPHPMQPLRERPDPKQPPSYRRSDRPGSTHETTGSVLLRNSDILDPTAFHSPPVSSDPAPSTEHFPVMTGPDATLPSVLPPHPASLRTPPSPPPSYASGPDPPKSCASE